MASYSVLRIVGLYRSIISYTVVTSTVSKARICVLAVWWCARIRQQYA